MCNQSSLFYISIQMELNENPQQMATFTERNKFGSGGSRRSKRVHFHIEVPRIVKPRFFPKSAIAGNVLKVRTCHFHPGLIVFGIKVDKPMTKVELKKLLVAKNADWNSLVISNLVSIDSFKKLHCDCHKITWVPTTSVSSQMPPAMPSSQLPVGFHLFNTIVKSLLTISVDIQHFLSTLQETDNLPSMIRNTSSSIIVKEEVVLMGDEGEEEEEEEETGKKRHGERAKVKIYRRDA